MMTEGGTQTMRAEFPRWYRSVDMSANRDRLESRWKGVVSLVDAADRMSIEAMVAIVFRTKPRPSPSVLATLRQAFKSADELFDAEDNDREMEILCGAALATLCDGNSEVTSLGALATITASCLGARRANFPLDLLAAAEASISRMAEERRKRPDLKGLFTRLSSDISLDPQVANNLRQGLNGETVVAALNAIGTQVAAGSDRFESRVKEAMQGVSTFAAIQDEELQILWWLFGGRSNRMDRPFASVPKDAQPLVFAAELADITEFLPGVASAKAMLGRAGLEERKKVSLTTAVNACDASLLAEFVDQAEPSPITHPIHFAIKRKLETGDENSWVAGWSAATGIEASHSVPAIELGSHVYRERLSILLGETT